MFEIAYSMLRNKEKYPLEQGLRLSNCFEHNLENSSSASKSVGLRILPFYRSAILCKNNYLLQDKCILE